MNAQVKPIDIERESLRDRLHIAHERLDAARREGLGEYDYWLNRVRELRYELYGSSIKQMTLSLDERAHYGDREEQREGASNGAINWEG
jgi:hypothetical protein